TRASVGGRSRWPSRRRSRRPHFVRPRLAWGSQLTSPPDTLLSCRVATLPRTPTIPHQVHERPPLSTCFVPPQDDQPDEPPHRLHYRLVRPVEGAEGR